MNGDGWGEYFATYGARMVFFVEATEISLLRSWWNGPDGDGTKGNEENEGAR